MKFEIIGFRLLRNNKRGFIFTMPIFSYINKNQNKYTIKDCAEHSRYAILLSCIDDEEERGMVQFKYSGIRNRLRPKVHIPIRNLSSSVINIVINIKRTVDEYRKVL